MDARALVAAVLRPHHREDAELGQGRLAAQASNDAVVLVGLEAVTLEDSGVDWAHIWWNVTRSGRTPWSRPEALTTDSNSTQSVGAAEDRFAGAFGVRHQADDVPRLVADAGDVVERSVRVGGVADRAGSVAVAEHDPSGRLQLVDHVGRGEVVAFAVGDRQLQHLAARRARGERRVGLLDADADVLAVKLEVAIAQHRAGQQPGLEQDLEAVADAEHRSTPARELGHRRHDRREPRDGAGAQVVAVREAAGQDRRRRRPSRLVSLCQTNSASWPSTCSAMWYAS